MKCPLAYIISYKAQALRGLSSAHQLRTIQCILRAQCRTLPPTEHLALQVKADVYNSLNTQLSSALRAACTMGKIHKFHVAVFPASEGGKTKCTTKSFL